MLVVAVGWLILPLGWFVRGRLFWCGMFKGCFLARVVIVFVLVFRVLFCAFCCVGDCAVLGVCYLLVCDFALV